MNKLTTSLILLIALLSSSCKTEREVTIKGPVSSSKVVEATGQESESFQVVDILTPQKFNEELAPKKISLISGTFSLKALSLLLHRILIEVEWTMNLFIPS